MGQPFSGMTQTGFNTMTLYGTAAQTRFSGMYGSTQYGQTGSSGPTQLPNIPAPNVGDYPPNAQAKLNTIYNAYRQSAANQAYYASQYANRPGNHFVAPSLANQLELIKDAVLNESLGPDVIQSGSESWWDGFQTGLDVVGMVPVFGEFADGLNVGIHLVRGNYAEAALSSASMVPFLGIAPTVGKVGRKLGLLETIVHANPNQAANLTKIREGITEVTNLERAIQSIPPTSLRPSLNSSLPGRVTQGLPTGGMRTPAEVKQAGNFFERNREAARKWWPDRNGGKPWPKDAVHDSHPLPLKGGETRCLSNHGTIVHLFPT